MYQVHHIDAYTGLSAMVVEGIGLHIRDKLYPGHLGFWPMRKTMQKCLQLCLQNIRPFFV